MISKLLLMALGGAIGTVLRYGVSGWALRLLGTGFPWGTLAVNVLGSLVIGFVWSMAERSPMSAGWSAFLFVGLLGAFTTFSTFSLESMNLFRDGETALALLNAVGSSTACIVAAFAGHMLGRLIGG